MHKKVNMVCFAIEFRQHCTEVFAYIEHGFFTYSEHVICKDRFSIFWCEDQVTVEVVDDMSSTAYIGVWYPSG